MGSEKPTGEGMQFILKLLQEKDVIEVRRSQKEKALELKELDGMVGSVERRKGNVQFMQIGELSTLSTHPPNFNLLASLLPSTKEEEDWVSKTRDRLFQPPYRIGRVFTLSGSVSGTGWVLGPFIVITCAHIIHQAKNEPLFFQLPDDRTVISLSVIFCGTKSQVLGNYKMDIACLKMDGVVGSTQPLHEVPLVAFVPGFIDWTGKCVTVGILKPYSANVPNLSETQKMLNEGRVESISSSLVTVSARADCGFSGGPIMNTSFEIVGMVQGSEGDIIKTVKMIPIDDLVRDFSVISYFVPGLPSFQLCTGVGGATF